MIIKRGRTYQTGGFDFYPTPPWATRCLFEHVLLPMGLFRDGDLMWEPACGQGHMSSVLKEYGRVKASDLIEYGGTRGGEPTGWVGSINFLDPLVNGKIGNDVDWIITNPPFAMSSDFTQIALSFPVVGVAYFLPTVWLGGSLDRYECIFTKRPPTMVAQFVERMPMEKGALNLSGTATIEYCWVIWLQKQAKQKYTELRWIPPGQKVALTKLTDITELETKAVARVVERLTDPFGFKKDSKPVPKQRRVKLKAA